MQMSYYCLIASKYALFLFFNSRHCKYWSLKSHHWTEPRVLLKAVEGVADIVVCAVVARKHDLADAVDPHR